MFLSSFPPGWLLPFVERIAPGIVYGPLTAPDGWRDSMDSPEGLRLLVGLLVALLLAVAWGRWSPPPRGNKISTARAFSYRNSHTHKPPTQVP